jgi:hypothetical protein
VGEREEDARRLLRDQLPDPSLVVPVGVGVDEHDGDGLGVVREQRIHCLLGGGEIERLDHLAVYVESFGHLTSQPARYQRLRLVPAQIVEAADAQSANLQDVPESPGGDEARAGAAVLQDRVGGGGRAVDDGDGILRREAGLLPERSEAVHQRGDHFVRRGRDLEGADAPVPVHDDEVTEGAADVDAHTVAHARAYPSQRVPTLAGDRPPRG